MIIACALRRKESRGLHYTRDHPASRDPYADQDTVVTPDASRFEHGRFEPGQRLGPRYRIVGLLGKGWHG